MATQIIFPDVVALKIWAVQFPEVHLGTADMELKLCFNGALERDFKYENISTSSNTHLERRGSVVVSTSACHAAGRGSIPGPVALLG